MPPAFTFVDYFLFGFWFAAGVFSFGLLGAAIAVMAFARLMRWLKSFTGA